MDTLRIYISSWASIHMGWFLLTRHQDEGSLWTGAGNRSWKGEGACCPSPCAGGLCTIGQAVHCPTQGIPFTSLSVRRTPTRTVYEITCVWSDPVVPGTIYLCMIFTERWPFSEKLCDPSSTLWGLVETHVTQKNPTSSLTAVEQTAVGSSGRQCHPHGEAWGRECVSS